MSAPGRVDPSRVQRFGQRDADRGTDGQAVDLGQALFYCILLFATFVAVLWELSGVIHVDIGGTVIPVPGFMVFVALTYSAIGTSLALWAGFPLVGANFRARV